MARTLLAGGIAEAIEAALKAGDKLAGADKTALQQVGLTLEQVAAARKQALDAVQKAMVEAKQRIANCETCKLLGAKGEKRTLQMPKNGPNGRWAGGVQPADGNGVFQFAEKKVLPDGREVSQIEYRNGAPNFDEFVEGGKHQLWQVTGDAEADGKQLTQMMRETDPAWKAPDSEFYTLHHFEDGSVGYVPQVIHDRTDGGVAHTGGASMTNNRLF